MASRKKRAKKGSKKTAAKKGVKKFICRPKGSKGAWKIKRTGRKAPKSAKAGKKSYKITCKPRKR